MEEGSWFFDQLHTMWTWAICWTENLLEVAVLKKSKVKAQVMDLRIIWKEVETENMWLSEIINDWMKRILKLPSHYGPHKDFFLIINY